MTGVIWIASLSLWWTGNFSLAERQISVAQKQVAALRLIVRTEGGIVIDGAEAVVRIDGHESTARTGTDGRARFEGLKAGIVEIRVRSIGYSPATLNARIAEGENEFTIRMLSRGAMLDEIRIVGNRLVSGSHEDFDLRAKQKLANATVSQEQIQKRNPIALSQMLRGISGIRLADSSGATVAISNRGVKFDRVTGIVQCVLLIAVDGTVLPSANIDAVPPRDVYGIEVYFGPARIPPQFNGLRSDSWCGLIAIWTRKD